MASLFVRVAEAVGGERPKWIVLFNGVQQGGMYDASGAGNREFESEREAIKWVESILHDIPFKWEK